MVIKETFIQFCQETSLPGWANVINAKNRLRKFCWILLIVGCHIAVFVLCYKSTHEFIKSRTLTTTQSTSEHVSELNFPVFVICNINQLQGSFLKQLGSESDPEVEELFVSEFLYGRKGELSLEQNEKLMKMKKIMEKEFSWNEQKSATDLAVQKCSNMVLSAFFNGKTYTFGQDDSIDIDTPDYISQNDFGTCCYFDINQNKSQNFIKVKSGVRNGVQLQLDMESFEYADSALGSQGWRFWMGNQGDKPLFGFSQTNIAPGR